MKIADIHAHIFPEKLAEKASHSIGSFYGVPIEREADMPRLCAEDSLRALPAALSPTPRRMPVRFGTPIRFWLKPSGGMTVILPLARSTRYGRI